MDNKTMSFILIIVVVVVFIWVIYPIVKKYISPVLDKESFDNKPPVQKPHVNPTVGSLIDGPGFEGVPEKITPQYARVFQPAGSSVPSNYYFLDDGDGGDMSIQYNLCSKSCCSPQWPTPFKLKYDPYVCANKDKFVPSRIFCNNTYESSGCLCLTKDQARFIYNRGGNGREWF